MSSASSMRPLPLLNGFGSPSESTCRKARGRVLAKGVRIAANEDLQVRRFFVVGQSGRNRILRRHGFFKRFVIRLHSVDMRREIGAQAALQRPVSEFEQPGSFLFLGVLVDRRFREILVEHIGPQVARFPVHALQIDLMLDQLALDAVRQGIEFLVRIFNLGEFLFVLGLYFGVLFVDLRPPSI